MRIAELQESASLIVHRLTAVERILCAAPAYLEAHRTPEDLDDLRHHSCLHYGQLAIENQWVLIEPDGEQTVSVRGVLIKIGNLPFSILRTVQARLPKPNNTNHCF